QVIGLTILESGLPAGASWSIELDYQVITSNATSILVVNVPKGITIFQKLLPFSGASTWGEQVSQTTVPATAVYNFPTTLTLVYSILLYYNLSQAPSYSAASSTASCNPSTTYCFTYYYYFHYIYECVPVVGYTCNTAPANTAASGYQSTCSYFSQVGCYYLYVDEENETEFGPGGYQFTYIYTYLTLYTYTTSSGYQEVQYMDFNCEIYQSPYTSCNYAYTAHGGSTSCSGPVPLTYPGNYCAVGSTVGIWLPQGFTLVAMEDYYSSAFSPSAPQYPNYFNGTGSGSYNGKLQSTCLSSNVCPIGYYNYYEYAIYIPYECYYNYLPEYCDGSGLITMNSPINETMWNLPGSTGGGSAVPGYPVYIQPQGLPKGTPYSFSLGGIKYSASSPSSVLIDSVNPGTTQITNGTAPGAQAGWEYYAPAVTITVPQDVIVNLTFSSYVNLSAPARPVSIHALNLTAGIAWSAEFNGTIYPSSIPWINTTARPGFYSVTSWGVNSTVGDTQFAPLNVASADFATQTTYSLSFQPSYRVGTSASSGGTIQLGTGKAGSGTSAFYKT
ncbi:MAG TPA: hypothetical protein VGX00_03715, partial [Thermoplasmata archaeon]|nr:hypothetical protein [Thermoplasmata archaeon]